MQVLRVVHPLGWLALALHLLSISAWLSFHAWGRTQARRLREALLATGSGDEWLELGTGRSVESPPDGGPASRWHDAAEAQPGPAALSVGTYARGLAGEAQLPIS
ncbi:hypothetical protein T492DRAFT_838661 [Pavlovales sp. CCMP2436]|nr:hypothetical protein T492DRAFT_838661 [Pavlovales sp. CCMP2436]